MHMLSDVLQQYNIKCIIRSWKEIQKKLIVTDTAPLEPKIKHYIWQVWKECGMVSRKY